MDSSTRTSRHHGHPSRLFHFLWLTILCITLQLGTSFAQPVSLPFSSCSPSAVTEPDPSKRVNITGVYGQLHHRDDPASRALKLVAFGEVGDTLEGYSNQTGYLATLFTSTNYLTYSVFDDTSALCDSIRPPSPLPTLDANDTEYCPLAAGKLAFGLSIPLNEAYSLKTLVTQIRIVDSSSPAHELTCMEVTATPLYLGDKLYGPWTGIFWVTIGLTLAYWTVTGIGRISAAWDRGLGRSGNILWMKVERTGFILASALSGEKFSVYPALLRFATPSARDLMLTTQWCASLAMISVQWPEFAYPIFSNAAWSTLLSNTTLVSGTQNPKSWNPLQSDSFQPFSVFAEQIADSNSPLHLDTSESNVLLNFPPNAKDGMAKFVSSVGVLPQNAFGICMSTFLLITASVIVLSTLITIIGWTGSALSGKAKKPQSERKDALESDGRRRHWKRRFSLNSFHGSVAHGNLVRLLILFHFPITIYSCYHLTLDSTIASPASKALAGLSFTLFSFILPGWLIFRVVTTNTSRLYEATRTLLALGPLYNQYQPRSQLFCILFFASNIVVGMVVGFGQKNGTVQAVIILIIEVLLTLSTSVWLPWMTGAQMGVISFMFCVARIIATVLVVILAPPVNIGSQAGGWIAFGIISVLGLIYVAFTIMLIVKILEGLVRIFRGLSFASSRHSLDSGLFGALGCCGGSSRNKKRRRRRTVDGRHSRAYSESTQATLAQQIQNARPSGVSYLKPEQASMPYRESSDDDAGFIMESWSKTDLNLPAGGARSQSKLALEENVTAANDSAPSSGFARVGGGRAHFDTPYAIVKGKQPLAPGRSEMTPAPSSQFSQPPPITPRSTSRSPDPLPKGAARPVHSRTRSQTAVIEDASNLLSPAPATSASRPNSAGNTASRPGSAGRSTNHGHGGRPSSSGKSPAGRSSNSRPPSAVALPRPPSGDVPTRTGFRPSDEMGVSAASGVKSASTSKGKGRGWFGLGGPSGGDSSSDEDDEGNSKNSSTKKSSRWGFKKRRMSESDMTPVPTSPVTENRSFVVIRNRPPNLNAVPLPNATEQSALLHADEPSATEVSAVANPLSSSNIGASDTNDYLRTTSPPSSYHQSRTSRLMSNPST
ncbi:hypothetical protein CPB86DRAFT_762385 [Serendipita vermifera]|nr:hypothetical protein CPB86DRAFT_762385 [Serendipita vermifera]